MRGKANMTTHLHRRGVVAIVFALIAAACTSAATDTMETTTTTSAATTTTEAITTTTSAATTTTTTTSPPATTTTTATEVLSGPRAIFDAALAYVTPGGDQYDYSGVQDDLGILSVSLPTAWSDLDGSIWTEDDRRIGSSIVAADSIDTFYSDFSAPGIFIGVSDGEIDNAGPEDITDNWDFSSSCTLTSNDLLSTDSLDGRLAVWTACGDTNASLLTVVGLSSTEPSLTLAIGIVRTVADLEAYTTAIDTLSVSRELGTALDSSAVVELVAEYIGDPVSDPGFTFVEVRDDSDTLTIRAPSTWTDTAGEPWDKADGDVGESLTAAPDISGFTGTWTVPGVFYGSSEEQAIPDTLGLLLNEYLFDGDCTYGNRYAFENTLYAGVFDIWTECGGTDTVLLTIEAYRPSKPYVAFLEVQIPSPEDLAALETILDSFDVLRRS